SLFTGMTGPGGAECAGTDSGDPIVLYDTKADRWLASQFTTAPGVPAGPTYECIAISKTGDPTGNYWRYAFQASPTNAATTFEDYPHFGVWSDAYYMATNEFNVTNEGVAFVGAGNFAFERAKMLAGDPAAKMVYFHLPPPYGGLLPSDLDGPTAPPAGSPNFFIEADDDFGSPPADMLSMFKFHVDWSNVLSSTFTGPITTTVAPFDTEFCTAEREACIPQPGTTQKLEVISDRLMYRLAYRNFGDHESLVVNHTVDADGTGHAGVRWYELRSPNATPTIYQQGTYAPDASHRWMGSTAMDGDGNLAIGYSVSNGTNVYTSIRYAGRLATDPLGQLSQGEGTLYPGYGSQTANARWGDYSMLGIDPSDDCSFWYTQEYYGTTGQYWSTRIGKFRFASCGGGSIPTETPIPAPDVCTLPGATVATDAQGDAFDILGGTGTDESQRYDIESISIAEPYTATGANHLVFTMKVASFAGPENDPSTSPSSYWRIFFNKPGTATLYFVDMRTDANGNITYKYGTGTSTTVGDADGGSYGFDGSARIRISYSKLGLTVGDTLTGIYGRVSNGAVFADNINYPEPDRSVAYTLVGNPSCAPAGVDTATPTSTLGATSTSTAVLTATSTLTTTETTTPLPSNTSTAVASSTSTQVASSTSTNVAASATSTSIVANTSTATRTSTSLPTGTPTRTATRTATSAASSTPQPTFTACPIQFADVPPSGEGSTFYSFVRCLACRGIVGGYPCGSLGEDCNANNEPYYRPNANVTRGQLSKIVANSAGLDDDIAEGQQQFADVKPGDPFYIYVERLAQTGAIAGYPCGGAGEDCDDLDRPYFRPNDPATRGQISKIVSIAAGFDEEVSEDQQTFTDVTTDSPFWVYIERLATRGIISGYGEEEKCPETGAPCFRYNDNTTRGQMAKIAANTFFPNCQTP
ncbi:MAG: S-layer homology domain-containing protein, partial [Chloroflexota bacterium]|nr:S-layer homology domain-containing protein [Chloroflexota bacterium]